MIHAILVMVNGTGMSVSEAMDQIGLSPLEFLKEVVAGFQAGVIEEQVAIGWLPEIGPKLGDDHQAGLDFLNWQGLSWVWTKCLDEPPPKLRDVTLL